MKMIHEETYTVDEPFLKVYAVVGCSMGVAEVVIEYKTYN